MGEWDQKKFPGRRAGESEEEYYARRSADLAKGRSASNGERLAAAREREAEVMNDVRDNEAASLARVHGYLTLGLEDLMKQWRRSKGAPPRHLIEAVK